MFLQRDHSGNFVTNTDPVTVQIDAPRAPSKLWVILRNPITSDSILSYP